MDMPLTRREVLSALAAVASPRFSARAAAGTPSPRGLRELLSRRRMVRRFRPDPVGEQVVSRLLDAATRAPSAGHTEPWAFVVVRDEATRAALGRAALGQLWLSAAPVSIVTCADLSRSRLRYGERGERYAWIDGAFASLLLLLAVVEEGLGACFVGAFEDAEVRRLLRLPVHVQPLAIIPVGYAAEHPRKRRRRPLEQLLHHERWRGPGQPTATPHV